jgi:hypothetical protein
MTDEDINQFEQEHLRRWWETTRRYLFADMKSLPGAAAEIEDGWLPRHTDSLYRVALAGSRPHRGKQP